MCIGFGKKEKRGEEEKEKKGYKGGLIAEIEGEGGVSLKENVTGNGDGYSRWVDV